jgi:hypothetical protein
LASETSQALSFPFGAADFTTIDHYPITTILDEQTGRSVNVFAHPVKNTSSIC